MAGQMEGNTTTIFSSQLYVKEQPQIYSGQAGGHIGPPARILARKEKRHGSSLPINNLWRNAGNRKLKGRSVPARNLSELAPATY
jgi:hypothetical protein